MIKSNSFIQLIDQIELIGPTNSSNPINWWNSIISKYTKIKRDWTYNKKIENLINQIKQIKSFLCVGLDVDLNKIPKHLHKFDDPIFEFSKEIIDSTSPFAIAYKPNVAFFESYGLKGWNSLEKVINYINLKYPEIFTIADAKRGDIGNTSSKYARTFYET